MILQLNLHLLHQQHQQQLNQNQQQQQQQQHHLDQQLSQQFRNQLVHQQFINRLMLPINIQLRFQQLQKVLLLQNLPLDQQLQQNHQQNQLLVPLVFRLI